MTGPFSAVGRERALDELERTAFDVLVIGGGITGSGVARDASLRGLLTALVERDDFASGTSSRSSRLVHGGLRYLEHGHLHLVFESSRERRTLLRIAPHLVRPLGFVWPVYENARVTLGRLRAGLWLYDALALFRNIALARRLDAPELAAAEPALRPLGLVGGARYFDAATNDIRLTLATARAAADAGAAVANHLEVYELIIEGGAVRGARARDTLGDRSVEMRAAVVVNATGPWSDRVRALADGSTSTRVRTTKGVHVAVPRDRIGNNGAITLLSPLDGRVMFVLPAGSLTIIGTTDTDYGGPPDRVRATVDDVAYLLRSANAFFPAAHLTPADVVSAWAGVRPLVADGDKDPVEVTREHAITWTAPGLLTVTGGKLTTYRAMAAEVVDAVAQRFPSKRRTRSVTHRVPLPGGQIRSLEATLAEARSTVGVPAVAEHLVHAYGARWRDVWVLATAHGTLPTRFAPPLPYLTAELRYAVEEEMAMTLSDLLIRRLHLAYERPDHGVGLARAAADVVAPLLGWDGGRIDRELGRFREDVERIFAIERA